MKKHGIVAVIAAAGLIGAGIACTSEDLDGGGGDQGGAGSGAGGTGGGAAGDGGPGGSGGTPGPCTEITVSADIGADAHWTADSCYTLATHVFVTSGATLTIDAGTLIKGDAGSSLVITRGSKIDAQGTAARPIVFTSSVSPGNRSRGDWGGVVLLGAAPINVPNGENSIEGFPASAGAAIHYGGNDPADDSGSLKYVRIEYAGFELAPDNELNGLTLGAVGNGTTIDHVQVHMGADDGIEFFGGTVNAKHLVVTYADDDGVDWDFGFKGKLQFVVVAQEANAGDCGIEADNNVDANDATPRSEPTIYNATLIGSDAAVGTAVGKQRAAVLRRGTGGHLFNFVVAHFADFALDVRDDATVAQAGSGLTVKNSLFFDNAAGADWTNTGADDPAQDGGFDEGAQLASGDGNRTGVDPQLDAATNLDAPRFKPAAGSPVFQGGATPPDDGFLDPTATHVGAIGETDWLAGWTAYDPS